MLLLSDLFSLTRLEDMIRDRMVSVQTHPDDPELRIYNYTHGCQYSQCWNEVTLQCRGLIARGQEVIARPFPKFFNVEEVSRSDIIWKQPFQVFEKVDGSLGVVYPHPDGSWAMATRGSFTGEQALEATTMLREVIELTGYTPQDGYTEVFEIIYPENRIVVNYGDVRELVYLCSVHVETGANIFESEWPGRSARRYDGLDCHPRELAEKHPISDAEGYVLYFPNGNRRMKAKFEEYKRLHAIVYGTSNKTIWKLLSEGGDVESILDRVPDEFYAYVRRIEKELEDAYTAIDHDAQQKYARVMRELDMPREELRKPENRLKFVDKVKDFKHNHLLFLLLDQHYGKYDALIWKLIKPEWERPFLVMTDDGDTDDS